MMQIELHGRSVHYEDDGDGDLVLTLVHGDPGRPQDFRWLIPLLSPYFRVIRIALPGFDLTELSVNPAYNIVERAAFIRDFLDSLKIDKTILLGHSMGSALVLEHGVRWPNNTLGVILLNPVGLTPHKPFRIIRENPLISILESPLRPMLLGLIRRVFIKLGFPKGVSKSAILHVIRCGRKFDFSHHTNNIKSLSVPCLRIHSKDDPLIDFPRFLELDKSLLPGSKHIFDKAGHNPQKSKPEILSKVISKWINELDSDR